RTAAKSLYSEIKVTSLLDADVTRSGLEAAFSKLAADIRPTDAFVLYVAGRDRLIGGRYVFSPQNFDPSTGQNIEEVGIDHDLWQAWISAIPAQQTLLIFDTSESATVTGRSPNHDGRQAAVSRLQQATGQNVIAAVGRPSNESYRDHSVLMYSI